ncbi:XRE family transcriptional regulator [uncultured Vibrio sp.]|uniref:XRE family transcriptional regulator n=1 Tax=uncultured Vibrio sp. TaxID=114054 RepID=UPI0026347CFB|nr:XRE family transcriptional regulator [uncultured Vibrio sp.]
MTKIELAVVETIRNSGLSNYEIAKSLNISRSLVGRWAKTGRISVENLSVLCAFLQIDANRLLQIHSEDHHLSELEQEIINLLKQSNKDKSVYLPAIRKLLS